MKKVIVSVIAVFLVQAGFIAFTSLDRQTDEEVKIAPAVSAPTDNARDLIADIAPGTAEENYIENSPMPVRVVYSPERKNRINTSRPDPSPKQVFRQSSVAVTDFEPVVIAIKAPRVRPQPEQPQVAAANFDRTEKQAFSAATKPAKKRSFFSKSMSVIKTPFRWIKSLGSKIL